MKLRSVFAGAAVTVFALTLNTIVAAQAGVALSGRLVNALTGELVAGATLQIDELRRQTTSTADGTFTFENVPPARITSRSAAPGYSSRRTEVHVSATRGGTLDVTGRSGAALQEVVSVSAERRGASSNRSSRRRCWRGRS